MAEDKHIRKRDQRSFDREKWIIKKKERQRDQERKRRRKSKEFGSQ